MKSEYVLALSAAVVAVASAAAGLWLGSSTFFPLLVAAAAAGPVAVLAAISGRLEARVTPRAIIGGGTVGPLVAVASHAMVGLFVYSFVIGFADTFTGLLDRFRADPELIDVLSSPWLLVSLISVAAVAPLTEEAGKALGAAFARPSTRREAFLAGAAAGVGFSVVENLVYVGFGSWFGGPWPVIAMGRLLGAAVHPLASGLVMLGWWEWRRDRKLMTLLRGYLAGVGVHALWNGSVVVFGAVETAYGLSGSTIGAGRIGLGYLVGLGALAAVGLWRLTETVAGGSRLEGSAKDGRLVAGWLVVTASLLVPVSIMILSFPDFYGG